MYTHIHTYIYLYVYIHINSFTPRYLAPRSTRTRQGRPIFIRLHIEKFPLYYRRALSTIKTHHSRPATQTLQHRPCATTPWHRQCNTDTDSEMDVLCIYRCLEVSALPHGRHSHARKMKVATSVSKQIWACTTYLLSCNKDLCLHGAPWHRYDSNLSQICRTKILTTFHVLYLSDSPEKTQICGEFSPAQVPSHTKGGTHRPERGGVKCKSRD